MLFHLENDLFALGSIERDQLRQSLLRGWDYRVQMAEGAERTRLSRKY